MKDNSNFIFDAIKESLLAIDPVYWAEKNLNLDNKPFRLTGNGYKPLSDIYRYIGIKAIEPNAKPCVVTKGRQVGMTTCACVLDLFFMSSGLFGVNGSPPIRLAHLFPQLELALSFGKTKLNNMIQTARNENTVRKAGKSLNVIESKLDRAIEANNSLQYKQFVGGNHIWVESVGINGQRTMGKTIDVAFFDEVQVMTAAALGNTTKTLGQAKYGPPGQGVQVYFGTPRQSGSEYWKIWNKSSQQYYHLGCGKCEKYFPLYTPGSNDWEKIWLYDFIVRCTHCGFEQDKRDAAERGKWISLNKDSNIEPEFVGFHINQLYMPNFTKEHILSEKPENSPINTERAYQNEVLGEFFAGSSSPITPEEIEKQCADHGRKFSTGISISDSRKIYLGCDWGDKIEKESVVEGARQQGQSYSCVVVLEAEGPHILSISYATRLKNNSPESKKEIIEEMYRRYSVNLGIGDIGHAGDLTYILQKEFGDKFLASRAVDTVKNHIKYSTDVFPKEVLFERTYYIEELYNMLKAGKIRFPFGDYEKIAWLIQHTCSMEQKVSQDRNGELKQRYVKGSTPNDGFMALLNCYIAYKFDITNGFTINDPNRIRSGPNERKPISAILGYVPGMSRRS